MTTDHAAPATSEPTLDTVQVTFYLCPHCRKRHSDEVRARACCLCNACGKAIGTKRETYDFECDSCFKKKRVNNALNHVQYARKKLRDAEESVEHWKLEIAKRETELAAAKALPTNRQKGVGL